MKGRAPTAEQKRFHDLLASQFGCIACAKDGIFTEHVSIHHIDGRTKPNAHWYVLPVCGPHHQDAGIPGVVSIHPWKTQWEEKYGTQMEVLSQCVSMLLERKCRVPSGALEAINPPNIFFKKTNPATALTVPGLSAAQA